MRTIEEQLAREGVRIIARSPLRHQWAKDGALRKAISTSDLIIINGEGTLHHGAEHGETLLKIALDPIREKAKVFLINALWQDNPLEWRAYLERMDGIWARDSQSAKEMSDLLGRNISWLPDMSLCGDKLENHGPRSGVLIGDSVNKSIARKLAELSLDLAGARLTPSLEVLKRAHGSTALTRKIRKIRARVYERRFYRRFPSYSICNHEMGYLEAVASAELHITGRFHGVCFSIAAGTPFLAVTSNTQKIESLLHDFGLSSARIISPDAFPDIRGDMRRYAFSGSELASISSNLAGARAASQEMFKRIVSSVRAN